MSRRALLSPAKLLSIGVTGHRTEHAAIRGRVQDVERAIASVVEAIRAAAGGFEIIRVHSMLADGVDQAFAQEALDAGWEHVAPLPFGAALTEAIGTVSGADSAERRQSALAEAQASLSADGQVGGGSAFAQLARRSRTFALAERDETLAALWFDAADVERSRQFETTASGRYALAARIIIEQSDLMIAVWDGEARTLMGGTGHTVSEALDAGVPVLWMHPDRLDRLRILRTHEDLFAHETEVEEGDARIACARVINEITRLETDESRRPGVTHSPFDQFLSERVRRGNLIFWRGYRLVERVFGRWRQKPGEKPPQLTRLAVNFDERNEDQVIADWKGSLRELEKLDEGCVTYVARAAKVCAPRFRAADVIATELSDAYRGGMVLNFLLAAAAVLVGLIYLPVGAEKWFFALTEIALIVAILLVTDLGIRSRWHQRWLESRRVAEYLRHAVVLLPLGVMRPVGRWPKGVESSWPEIYVRATMREAGLPQREVCPDYVRTMVFEVISAYVASQRDYHADKARRLHQVHKGLDVLSAFLFGCALLGALVYVGMHTLDLHMSSTASKWFTFMGVAFPMAGATCASLRFFGDFERFGSISAAAERNLTHIMERIAKLERAAGGVDYGTASRVAHSVESVFVEELESWQAIFGGKHMGIPV